MDDYLGDVIAPEGDVMHGIVRETHWDDVQKPLNLMDHCICKGEGLPVFHIWATFRPNDGVNLLLHVL